MKTKHRIIIFSVSTFFLMMSLWGIFWETPNYSQSERRALASFPDLNMEDIISGKFSKEFDNYAVERFPARDAWRQIKTYVKTKLFLQKDNNNIYTTGRHISQMEYPMNTPMMDYAIELFSSINEKYLDDNNIYLAIIPDKNIYLADRTGHLSMDYEKFSSYMAEHMEYAQYIEISDLLEADDYYYTDSHWRQDKIVDVAERIADAMGANIFETYSEHLLETDFYGVYAGQSALKCEPDTITYLLSDTIQEAQVEGAKAIYDMEKAKGKDPYEIFLSGNQEIISIKNRNCNRQKRLIMFRDSFGSSIAPLFIEGYSEIILLDLRYISSDKLSGFVDFENADVLYLYSTILLNNSRSMK